MLSLPGCQKAIHCKSSLFSLLTLQMKPSPQYLPFLQTQSKAQVPRFRHCLVPVTESFILPKGFMTAWICSKAGCISHQRFPFISLFNAQKNESGSYRTFQNYLSETYQPHSQLSDAIQASTLKRISRSSKSQIEEKKCAFFFFSLFLQDETKF